MGGSSASAVGLLTARKAVPVRRATAAPVKMWMPLMSERLGVDVV